MPVDKTQKQRMLAGELYYPGDDEIRADSRRCMEWLARYNATLAMPARDRIALLREIFAGAGDGAVVRPPFHCDCGYNITLGTDTFLNFGCFILDIVPVTIGDRTQIGPGVQLLTADHPREAAARESGLEFARPITIGTNVWIGGGALVLPGVSIGDHAIVGAGAVVTRDVAAGATVAGNPARPLATSPR